MVEADTSLPNDYNQKENEANIFKISSFPIDDTLTTHLKFRNQPKTNVWHANSRHHSVSHDRYLD